MVELKEPFATLWRGKDPFEEVKTLQGEVFRELETRRTLRFEMAGKSYFLKWHRGTTLKEIIKNLLSLRMPVLGADREWNAIHRLRDVGVDTMYGVAIWRKRHESADQNFIYYYRRSDTNHKSGRLLC